MQSAKTPQQGQSPRSELGAALGACRSAFIGVGVMSCVINVLYLTGSFFMLEVYDRVLPSRSIPTLVGLLVLAGNRSEGLQPLRDLDNIRAFLSGMGPGALFDLPWLPLYLAICFAFHPLIGVTALVGAIVLIVLTILTEYLTGDPMKRATSLASRRQDLALTSRRNAEVLMAMGMAGRVGQRWEDSNRDYLASSQRASDVAGGLGAIAKVMRMMLQSAVLGVGAYLVINQQATAGIIIAGSILSARALAPVDLAIAHWKGFVAARQSWHRLNRLLGMIPEQTVPTQLETPTNKLSVEALSVGAPGDQRPIVHDATFAIEAGQAVGVIGPSGSGKSSLVRALVGVWQPLRGKVRLDGAALDQWSPEILGRHIGYLPQDVELFAGTIAQNISRFEDNPSPDDIIAAAREARVHEMIIGMKDGYDTQIGDQGSVLSAGQAQRIALARALYGNPFLVVLDEPNSNLDSEGDAALSKAVLSVRARGGVVVIVAHRPIGIESADLVMVLKDGRVQAFGPKDSVLGQVLQRPAVAGPAIKIVSDKGGSQP